MKVIQIDTVGAPTAVPDVVPLRHRAGWLGEAVDGTVVAVLTVFVGAPAGLLWAAVRPSFDPAKALEESSRYSAALGVDVRFAIVTAIVGALVGLLAWALARRNGTGVVVGLLVGGLAAAWVAQRVGVMATHPDQLQGILSAGLKKNLGFNFAGLGADDKHNFLEDSRYGLRAMSLVLVLPAMAATSFAALTATWDRTSRGAVR